MTGRAAGPLPAPVTSSGLLGTVVAVVGGDEREQEIARLAASAGATVRAYGFPWPDTGIPGVELAPSAAAAMAGADYALFPIPGIATDGHLYAPHAPAPITPDAELLSALRPDAAIILGKADPLLEAAARTTGRAVIEYEDDAELMLLRGPAIVEGVLAVAIGRTPVTIHAAPVGVVGFGRIGGLLARSLLALHAQVTVVARSPVARAAAYAAGCAARPIEDLPALAPSLSMLFSTVPAPVVTRAALSALPPGSLVVDVAAPPGGVDLAAAAGYGHEAVWARGMGASAPVTVGRSQWGGILRRITEFETSRRKK
jgi:dipicolinate synthase subunit A